MAERLGPVGATLKTVKALKAHIHNGQIVLDEPIDLPTHVHLHFVLSRSREGIPVKARGTRS
jgi:hypothetical protein